jgi:hypothetical protein
VGAPGRALLGLALLGWLVPAAATLGADNPLREGVRRLIRPPTPAADPWREALRDVDDRLPLDREVAIWLDRVPEAPQDLAARGHQWVSAAYRLYPRRVFPLGPLPVVDALEARGFVMPAAARLMRARLATLLRGDASTLALLAWDQPCATAGPLEARPLRPLLTFRPAGCLLVAGSLGS